MINNHDVEVYNNGHGDRIAFTFQSVRRVLTVEQAKELYESLEYGLKSTDKSIKYIRIVAPHFVAGIDIGWFTNQKIPINHCPPILKYMKEWDENKIRAYCKKKGWKVES